MHQYIITVDVEKMSWQVKVSVEHQDLQRIVWRSSISDDALHHYRLATVTYGVISAYFMATQCLVMLADKEGHSHLKASKIIPHDFCMDI